jgi:hypothetical protein
MVHIATITPASIPRIQIDAFGALYVDEPRLRWRSFWR